MGDRTKPATCARPGEPAIWRRLRSAASLAAALLLAACAQQTSDLFPATVMPGRGKDLVAFQQDDAVCRQHALTHTGFGNPRPPAPAASPAAPGPAGASNPPAQPAAAPASSVMPIDEGDEAGYLQCMAARGDTVRLQPGYAMAPQPYLYGPPYGLPYGGPLLIGGLGVGLGFGGWHQGYWRHPGFAHPGFAHPGFARAGIAHGRGGHR